MVAIYYIFLFCMNIMVKSILLEVNKNEVFFYVIGICMRFFSKYYKKFF